MTDLVPDYLQFVAVSVIEADALEGYRLRLRFSDGFEGEVDVAPLLVGKHYAALREEEAFKEVSVDDALGTVVWSNGADLAPSMLRSLARAKTADASPAQEAGHSDNVLPFFGAVANRQLHYGDNLFVLRERFADESVDLIYLDPPFNSKRSYNAFFRTPEGEEPTESALAFKDFWVWNGQSERAYAELIDAGGKPAVAIRALRNFLGPGDLLAYLVMMAPRLVELRRTLRPSGSIYLHCDQTASHYLKVLMDAVFGAENFLNNVVWLYGLGGSSKRYWPRKHDDLLWYSKLPNGQFFEPPWV